MKPETRVLIIAVLIGVVLGFSLGKVAKTVKKHNVAKAQQLQSGRTTALEQNVKDALP